MKKFVLFACSYLLLSFFFAKDSRAGQIVSNTERKAIEQSWLIPICETDDCTTFETCSISKPSREQLEELQTICQNNETGESKMSPSQCYAFLDSLVNLTICAQKNVVISISNGRTIAHYKRTDEIITPPPPIYTILTPKVKKPLITPTQTQPTLSISSSITSTPSATPTPNQKMSRRATINEIIRLIKSLISSLFKSSPDMGDIAPNITPTLTINQESPTPSKSVCSQQQLTSLRVHILALSTRTKLTNGILNNVCLPKDIKEAYKNYTRLQSKFAKLDEQLCGQNKDGSGCTDGKIKTGDNSEASRIIRELERTDTDFKKASPPSGNYLLYENLLNNINKFLDSE